ncbi:MAG: response regulator [Desulfobacterales bacterium]|nr:response regulator [Desulfobacterales bacterium]
MANDKMLEGIKLLIVDDEPDILETLEEMLDMCDVDTAEDFEKAQQLLNEKNYDVAILDIMGVRGYDLLEIAAQKNIPALMLTAHALSPDNLVKSIKTGAHCYVPKEKISEITTYVAAILKSKEKGLKKDGIWFARLEPYFDKKFGSGWKEKDKEFWADFDKHYVVSRKDVEGIL